MALNDRLVKFAQPTAKLLYLNDGGGLYLKVSPRGTKTWSFRNQTSKIRGWLKIGRYPATSLADARLKAKELLATGLQAARTVAWAYSGYTPHLRRSYESWREIDRRFQVDILPQLGEKRLYRVSRSDCAAVLQTIVTRGSLVAANRTMVDLKHFFDYCVDHGWINTSPASGIKRKSIGGREKSKERALSFEELEQFIPHIDRKGRFSTETRFGLALIMLTGQRPSEVLGYDEKERQGCWWHIPPERVGKGSNPRLQKVYLSPQARHLFKLAVQLAGPRPFKCNHRTLSRAVARLKWQPPFTPHDLRRTMSTRLGDMGVAPHVVEKMLNHQMEGVMAVYNRAEYLPERKAAWRLWGAKVAQLRRNHAKTTDSPAAQRMRDDRVHPDNPGRSRM